MRTLFSSSLEHPHSLSKILALVFLGTDPKSRRVKPHYKHQNISVYNIAVVSIKSDKLFKHLSPPPLTPGEFLIKLPICFELALSSVHLCKIPGIIKDLSIENVFGLILLLIG